MRPHAFPIGVALVLTLFGAGCVIVNDGEPLQHQLEDARGEVEGLRTQVDRHYAQAMQTTDLTALRALEGPHHDDADEHMDDLDHVIGDMHMCGIDDADLLDHMEDVHHSCASELDRHRDTIATIGDFDAAMAEEDRHHAAMATWLDDLDETVDDLMDADADEMCHGHHGMHDHRDG